MTFLASHVDISCPLKKFGSEWYEGKVESNYSVIHSVYEDGDHDIIKEEEFKELFEKGKISNVNPKSRTQRNHSTKRSATSKRRPQKKKRVK